ncbi:BTB/POZ domain-containing protein [Aspergillus lucknowensis]|uniref:BTB domain-containing protein n=1 Tax=Aspergillus lucknowensis TaxID=176173 RepID=A0ABR4LNL7_9EURO
MDQDDFTISFSWDLQVRVNEYEFVRNDKEQLMRQPSPRRSSIFRVEKGKLTASSKYFYNLLSSHWKEANTDQITLEEDNITAMRVMFQCLHEIPGETSLSAGRIPLDSVSMEEVWHLVRVCDKYLAEKKAGAVHQWFVSWYHAQDKDLLFYRAVLLPCWAIDNPVAFQRSTMNLVYESPCHILEHNPTEHTELHLPPRIIQQLNAARGRLRNILHNGLFNSLTQLLSAHGCSCREKTVFNYLRELHRIEVWPLENTMKHASINDMLDRLDDFNSENVRPASADYCSTCSRGWEGIVARAAHDVRTYFGGLCLDCMSVSKRLREGHNLDHDYWTAGRNREYDLHCRIDHGEPTWWFSFMGRRERRGLIAY